MSRIIGFDFDGERVTAVEWLGGKTPSVGATFQAALPAPMALRNAESLGLWLRDELHKAGFRASEAVVVLSRSRIHFKSLEIPPCPPEELPGMVSFSVDGELASPSGEGVLDFQSSMSGDGIAVLAAMAAMEEVQTIAAALKAAKIHCRHIGPRAYAAHFVAEQTFEMFGHHPTLLAAPQDGLFEISVWHQDVLTAYRSIPLGSHEDAATRVAAEVRRTLAAVRSGSRPMAIERIGVVGNGPQVAAAVKDATSMPVHHVDPCERFGAADLSNLPGFTSAMSAAWREAMDAEWPIDFANPKRPIVKRDNRRPVLVMAAALALMLPVGAYSYAQYLTTVKSNRIKFVAEQIEKAQKDLAALRPTVQRHEEIKKWIDGDVNWAHELQVLAAVFPDTSEAFVTKIEMRSNEGVAAGQKPGTITLEGLMRSREVMSESQTRLAADAAAHYSPSPRGSTFLPERTDFQHSFKTDLAVNPLKPSQYEERTQVGVEKHAKSVPAGKRRDAISPASLLASAKAEAKPSTRIESQSPVAGSADPSRRSSRAGRDNRDGRESSSAGGSAEAEKSAQDPVERFVSQLKTKSFEEREKYINGQVPGFLRARVRKALSEAK